MTIDRWIMRTDRARGAFVLVLALATAALGYVAAAASAEVEPEIGRCVKVAKGTGTYGTSACDSIKTKNSYEWIPGAVKTGVTLSGKKSNIELEPETEAPGVSCTSDSGHGNYEGDTRIAGVVMSYHGCKLAAEACASEGAEAGEIVSEPLEGEYVRLHENGRAGLDLFPTSGRSGQFTSFTCGDLHYAVTGSLVGAVISGRMKAVLGLEYRAKEDVQSPRSYINAEGSTVEAFLTDLQLEEPLAEPQPLAIEVFGRQTSEEPIEVNTAL
jgi:hypothetical protein